MPDLLYPLPYFAIGLILALWVHWVNRDEPADWGFLVLFYFAVLTSWPVILAIMVYDGTCRDGETSISDKLL
jgi:hypothetical protein